jgi:glycosyltransferase involved in cell wall biosynthesis
VIKIAYIIDTIETPSAGTEQQLLMLLDNLDRQKFAPYLICLRNSRLLESQSFDFPVHILNIDKLLSAEFIQGIKKFKALHKAEKFDIVQAFFPDANIFGVIAARLAGVKVILAGRRNIGDTLTSMQLRALRLIRRYTTQYVANSRAAANMAEKLEGIDPKKIEVIYNGMYLDRFESISPEMRHACRQEWKVGDEEILIGLVANLRPVKNVEALIDAAAKLIERHSNLKFVVVGEGELRESLQARIDGAGLAQRFNLAGRYDDIIPCLAAFDIAVLCSKAEGFSNSLIEYMAAGLPVVASDVGGNSEAVKHGETGLVYSLSQPDGLAYSLTQLVDNRPLARNMGEKAKKASFEFYNVSTYIENHQNLYAGLKV